MRTSSLFPDRIVAHRTWLIYEIHKRVGSLCPLRPLLREGGASTPRAPSGVMGSVRRGARSKFPSFKRRVPAIMGAAFMPSLVPNGAFYLAIVASELTRTNEPFKGRLKGTYSGLYEWHSEIRNAAWGSWWPRSQTGLGQVRCLGLVARCSAHTLSPLSFFPFVWLFVLSFPSISRSFILSFVVFLLTFFPSLLSLYVTQDFCTVFYSFSFPLSFILFSLSLILPRFLLFYLYVWIILFPVSVILSLLFISLISSFLFYLWF